MLVQLPGRTYLFLPTPIMNVPGKRGEVHDQDHLSECDFNFRDWNSVDEIDNVAMVSTRLPEHRQTLGERDPLVEQMTHRKPVISFRFRFTHMNATQGIFGPLSVMTIP